MTPRSEPPDSQIKPYIFHFRHVFKQRMKYVDKIALFGVVLVSLTFFRHTSWTQKIFASAYEIPLLTAALQAARFVRMHNSTVDYSDAKTLYWQLLKTVSSTQFWVSGMITGFSAVCLMAPFISQSSVSYYVYSKEYRHKPLVNDQFIYFWFHSLAVGALYNMQAAVFQRTRLQFSYGIPINPPAKYLFAPVLRLVAVSLTFAVCCFVLVPLAYVASHSLVYRMAWPFLVLFGLDTKSAPLWTFLDLGFLLKMAWYSWVAIFVLEFFNHAFNTYASIGCLHQRKPISSHSANPMITLLSGVRDVRPGDFLSSLSHLCALQELAYISSSPDAEAVDYRSKIFSSKASMTRSLWPSILDECSLIIKNACSRVNFRSPADLSALRSVDVKALEPEEQYIFGNSTSVKIEPASEKPGELFDSFNESANDTTNLAISATSSPQKQYENPQQARSANPLQNVQVSRARAALLKVANVLDSNILLPLNKHLSRFSSNDKPISENVKQLKTTFAHFYARLLDTRVGFLWRTTLKRDTESRILNPVNYGNAVLTLSGLLLRSIEEDRSNTITNAHLSEVLNLLEKPVRVFANYTDFLPASVYSPCTKNHLVALMHDLTVKEYYRLAVKFNYKLNDLQLSPRASKLAKWVVAASLDKESDQAVFSSRFL